MKLSIITTIYNRHSEMEVFFENIHKQTFQDYELIVVIDTDINKQLSIISPWKEKFGSKLRIIFNSKRRGRTASNVDALRVAKGEYSLFIPTSDVIRAEIGLKLMAEELEKTKYPDILEFPLLFRGVEKWNAEQRISVGTSTKIVDRPEILAYAIPTHFGKLFKTKSYRAAIMFQNYTELNTRFSIELFYYFLINPNTTYAISKVKVIKTYIYKNSSSFNPMRVSKTWKNILSYSKNLDISFQEELIFASSWHMSRFLGKFIVAFKNKVMFQKQFNLIHLYSTTEWKNALILNKYISELRKTVDIEGVLSSKTSLQKMIKK